MNVLVTKNLSKKYKNVYAAKDVNMHIEKGDIYGFVGENGAGKTTIIRLIAGLASPTSGTYDLFGVNIKDKGINKAKSKLSAIVEAPSISKNMKPLDNLRFQAYISNVKRSDEELIELINRVGLNYEEIKDRKVGNFSLGMRQRLAIAIVMVSNPEFVLLDEPMNGLDPQGFVEVRETIMKLHSEGVTFLISSHILAELEKICNKIAFISHGCLLEELSIDELHAKSRRHIIIDLIETSDFENIKQDLNLAEAKLDINKMLIYDDIDINEILKYLSSKNIKINTINVKEDTIEDYYINLLGKEIKNA